MRETRALFEQIIVEVGVRAGGATSEDLDRIDRGGFVRSAADELKRLSEQDDNPERDIAAEALQRLYLEHMKLQAGQR